MKSVNVNYISKINRCRWLYGLIIVLVLISSPVNLLHFSPLRAFAATPTIIKSSGTLASPTKNSVQNQIFYNGTYWWVFYMKSTTANTLFYSYSSDLTTWTESSVALGGTVVNDGGTVSVYYDSASQTVIVSYYTNTNNDRYMRGAISGAAISWSVNTNYADATAKNATGGYTYQVAKDSSGKLLYMDIDTLANPKVLISTNTISATFSDSGAQFVNLSGADGTNALNDYTGKNAIIPLASGSFLVVTDDLNVNPCIMWNKYNGSTWLTTGLYTNAVLACAVAVSRTNWGITKLSNTDVEFLGQNTASTFSYQKFSGTAWSALTAPTWPTGGLATNSEVALMNDGSSVWAFVIRGDANNTVSYNKYSGTTWGGWIDLITTAKARSYIQVSPAIGANQIAVIWREVNGTNYDITVSSLFATFNQSAYRLFNNLDSTDVGTALAAQDTAVTLGSTGAAFRLRQLIHVAVINLALSGQAFKLQFAQQSGTCDTAFSGETYADVTAATAIAYNNNATPADGATLTANANDPTHGADTIVNQTYEELNNFTNSVGAINILQDGKWDFSLKDNGALASTAYCLRVVKSTGAVLDTYTVIPQITTAAASSQTLTFSLGASSLALGALSTSVVTTGSHTIALATNATNGMAVTYSGATLTSGANTITAMSVAAASAIGTSQFGLNSVANATPAIGAACSGVAPIAAAATGYAVANNFKFVTGQTVVSSAGSINTTTCTISYIANIAGTTPAGSYASTLTYVATATF